MTITATVPSSTNSPARAPAKRRRRRQTGLHVGLLVLTAVSLAPYIFMLITAMKNNEQYIESFWAPAWPLHLENFATAWQQIQPYMIASLAYAVGATVGIIGVSLLAGFVFARFRFPGRNTLFALIASLMMVPSIAALIPRFVMMRDIGMLDTYWVMTLPHIATGAVLGTILMRTYIQGIPQTIFDAAELDGASPPRAFWSIMLPMSLPVIGTVALVTVQSIWNDFFWPLLTITQDALRPIAVGLQFFQGQSGTEYGPLFAGYLLGSLPLVLLFVLFSKYFLAGVQGGLPGSH